MQLHRIRACSDPFTEAEIAYAIQVTESLTVLANIMECYAILAHMLHHPQRRDVKHRTSKDDRLEKFINNHKFTQ
jgi:hypothetical protein